MGALRRAAPVPSARPFLKRQQVVDTATCGTAARKKPARHAASAGDEFPVRDPKRAKVTCNGVVGSVDAALGTLRKRMAAELDAVCALLRKAELLSGGKNGLSMAAAKRRSEAPVEEASVKPPAAAKRGKASAALAMTAKLESRDLLPNDKDEFKDKKRAPPAAVSTATLIAKAKVRRTLLEMERAVVPDESILPRDLKDLCIVEYGRVSIMQRLGLFLKADA